MVIAGLRGGSGKTTLSIGLTRALTSRGLKVTSFKKGPDYIDAGWLARASYNRCYNLDPYLISQEKLLQSFVYHSKDSDIALVEGNRGIFDGVDIEGAYSTAELAKLIKSPVVLVVDCTKVTRTLAPMINGIATFDPDVNLQGVILNNIAGSRHETVIRGAIERYTDVKVIGGFRRLKSEIMPERHLGLTPQVEHPHVEEAIRMLSDIVNKEIDVETFAEIAKTAGPLQADNDLYQGYARCEKEPVVIGIIKDTAFQFYYPENIDSLEHGGVRIVEINAIEERCLPEIDALYIGGGFPETNAIALSDNRSFMASLKEAVEDGLPVYAECGGLMYLGREIEYNGKAYPMSGVLPMEFKMEPRPAAHGYTVVEVVEENPFYQKGTLLKGHEFHYSRVIKVGEDLKMAFLMKRGKGIANRKDGIVYKNVFATYTHLHALGAPEWTEAMIRAAERYRDQKNA